MKVILHTITGQKLTVNNTATVKEALKKAKLKVTDIFRYEVIMNYFEEIKNRGFCIVSNKYCGWYSYHGKNYIIYYNSNKFIELDNSKEADELFEQSEARIKEEAEEKEEN
jgi:hypothetical protein